MYFLFLGAVNTLAVREERYFKPSPSAFVRVAGRGPDAWQIRPGSYFLLPFHQAFHQEIPKDFTFYLTIKPDPESEGILFSLNARHTRQEYISLELNEGRLGLIHSLPNGSKIIDIPAKVSDGQWHQLAIRYNVQDAYLDFLNEFSGTFSCFFFRHTGESFTEQCPYGKVSTNFRQIRQKPTFKLLTL